MNVLIIESSAKGKTLQKYLKDDWVVIATGGHVETLPDDRKTHGEDAKKAYWANRPGELPNAPWVWTERGEKAVKDIVEAGGDEPVFWIATDPDREGEFIAWSLEKHLKPHGPTHRVTFQEITKEALLEALERPRETDRGMVESALVRKFLDRLVGYRASKMASGIVGRGASMGRVQSPTLGFAVERELEREAFVPTPYFEVRADAAEQPFEVIFHQAGSPDVWRDEAGQTSRKRTFSGEDARHAFDALSRAESLELASVRRRKPRARQPGVAFTTDALLQEAGSKFGWSPSKTSALASILYEGGQVTYIRTDSTRLGPSAVQSLRGTVAREFGEEELGTGASGAAAQGAQDAHEAIRPTRAEAAEAEVDDDDARKLYRLIRARALATQMRPSVAESVSVEARCDGMEWPLTTTVSWRSTLGWERAYAEFEPARPTALPEIALEEGARWPLDPPTEERPNPRLIKDETQPPSRYRPHQLVARMKQAGIGRPSTYARTVEKLEERKFVEAEDGALVPTERGRAIWLEVAPLYAPEVDPEKEVAAPEALAEALSDALSEAQAGSAVAEEFFSAAFTGEMEEGLDQVAGRAIDAAERWEVWRDHFRALHEVAQHRKKAGASTPSQRALIRRLLENAPPEFAGGGSSAPENLDELSFQDARDLIDRLREAGVSPAPTEAQLDYMRRLLEDLALPEEEVVDILGVATPEELRTTAAASQALDRLQELADERKPPSAKQRRFIEGLIGELEMDESRAAALVGLASLEELTGGREGNASVLIEALKARKEEPEAGKSG